MSENVEVRRGDSVASLVDELAKSVTESSITLPVDREVPEDEWVRFSLKLADGTEVMEGVGRSRGSVPRGNPVDHHDVVLVELSFDERSEIMWERLLIAAEAVETGDDTGTIQLGDGSIEELIPGSDAGAKPPELPSKRNAARASAPPPQASKPPPSASSSPKERASRSVAPPKPARPLGASTSSAGSSSAPSAARASSSPAARTSTRPAADATSTGTAASRAKPSDDSSADRPHSLDVPQRLAAEARRLSTRLPTEMVKDRAGNTPDNVVLLTALRMGLAALDAQTRRGD